MLSDSTPRRSSVKPRAWLVAALFACCMLFTLGIAESASAAVLNEPIEVPSLTDWGIVLMVLLLAGGGMLGLHGKGRTSD